MLYLLAFIFFVLFFAPLGNDLDLGLPQERDNDSERDGCIVIFALILCCACCLGIFLMHSNIETYEKLTNTQEIVSFDDSNSDNYICKYQTEDGKYKPLKLNKEKTDVTEEDFSQNARVCTYTTYKQNKTNKIWGIILLFNLYEKKGVVDERYEIYVPKGTIEKIAN